MPIRGLEILRTKLKRLKKYPRMFRLVMLAYRFTKSLPDRICSIPFWCIDSTVPKDALVWIFPVHFYLDTFSDNLRAVFEEIKDDASITKVILIRNKPVDVEESLHVFIAHMYSFKALWFLLRSGVIFVQHSVYLDLSHRGVDFHPLLNLHRRIVINLWHGTTIKSLASHITGIHTKRITKEKTHYRLISSSKIDRLAMAVSFSPISFENVWITGLPRNDFLRKPEHLLPKYCQEQLMAIREKKGQRSLIAYAPTYRELSLGGSYYAFSDSEISRIKELMRSYDAVLGIRMHYYNRCENYSKLIDDQFVIDLDSVQFPDMGLIIREADVIISDYSSLLVEAMYFPKRVLCFAYDLQHYDLIQRGFFYNLDQILPAPICTTLDELLSSIESSFKPLTLSERQRYEWSRSMFFDFCDSKNASRVLSNVRRELKS